MAPGLFNNMIKSRLRTTYPYSLGAIFLSLPMKLFSSNKWDQRDFANRVYPGFPTSFLKKFCY